MFLEGRQENSLKSVFEEITETVRKDNLWEKAILMLKDPKDMYFILGHLDNILDNAGLSSMLLEDSP